MGVEYIYDPEIVDEVLRDYPLLSTRLQKISRTRRESVSFPKCWKTRREIYRILSNQHYLHLAELLRTLNYCVANGYEDPQLLRTSALHEFDSSVSALFVAESFLKRGMKATWLDPSKGPDMLVESGKHSLSVEVFCPRDWEGLDHFRDELELGISHLDVPWDFRFEINMQLINDSSPEGDPIWFDPCKFHKANMNSPDRWNRIEPFLTKIEKAFLELARHGKSEIVENLREDNLNILTEVRISQIQKCQSRTPDRPFNIVTPILTGQASDYMFDRAVKKKFVQKNEKGQAQSLSGKDFSALVIDLSLLDNPNLFSQPCYLKEFGKSIISHFDPKASRINHMVVFCLRKSHADANFEIPIRFLQTPSLNEAFIDLFGGNHSFTALSNEVSIKKLRH